MTKPIIGIVPSCSDDEKQLTVPRAYINAVERAGGTPLIFPHTADTDIAAQLTALCGGFIFTGGADIAPALYGEEPRRELGSVSPLRDSTDKLFFERAITSGKPILGICRGLQMINVCMGGTLYQDLCTQFPGEVCDHRISVADSAARHTVIAERGSLAFRAYGETSFEVNSLHHQAVKSPAPGLTVTAKGTDGVIEALEGTGGQFIALFQWHPELLAPENPASQKIFDIFVSICK